jgi:hypothetical protein
MDALMHASDLWRGGLDTYTTVHEISAVYALDLVAAYFVVRGVGFARVFGYQPVVVS